MSTSEIVKEALAWLLKNFGKQILVVVGDFLQHQWSRLFASRPVMFLGPRQAGKSSLINYLRTGKPYELDKSGTRRTPDPTALAAIVDEKFSVSQKKWLKIKQDLPGDQALRAQWKQAIDDIHPLGIVYLVDGSDAETVLAEVKDGCREVLDICYPDGPRELVAFHVFVSFSDRWATSPQVSRSRQRSVAEVLDDELQARPLFASLRTGVSIVHLSPSADIWSDAKRAVERFGTDIAAG